MNSFKVLAAAAVCAVASTVFAQPVELRCESASNPLAINTARPRFSWQLAPEKAGVRQSAYQILVSSSPELLAKGQGDLWDSGRVQSDETLQIAYAGKALTSEEHAFWKVLSWNGQTVSTSDPATFAMGLLAPSDWKAQWIGFPDDTGDKEPQASPCFRKEFSLDKPVARATVHVCGLGQYELSLNGKKVGDAVLTPAWTTYNKTCSYDTYDVTSQVKAGGNGIGIMLGDGMYNVLRTPGRYSKFTGSSGTPKVIMQLHVEYADGTQTLVTTDGTWKTTRGPVTYSHAYGGEDYDARREMPGWNAAGFDDARWSAAAVVPAPGEEGKPAQLMAAVAPQIKVQKSYAVVKVTQPRPNTWVYDFGQNVSGWPHLRVRGPAGSVVKMIPGELLYRDGTAAPVVDAVKRGINWYTYTLKGGGRVEEWQPRFGAYGFRYLQVEGAAPPEGTKLGEVVGGPGRQPAPSEEPAAPRAQLVEINSEFLYADCPRAGSFESSDEVLNKVHHLITYAILSNTQSVLTDCPQREKLGWLEQSHLMADSIAMTEDVSRLYAKMCRDMQDTQLADGLVPNIAPEYTVFKNSFRDSPEWGAAAIIDPWVLYTYYGDQRILQEHYDSMKAYAAYLGTKAEGHLLSQGLGDWFDNPPSNHNTGQLTSTAFTTSAIYFHDINTLRKIAEVLHKDEDARTYGALAAEIRSAFNAKFFDPVKKQYERASQTASGMPLAIGLVEPANRETVLKTLVETVQANKYMVSSGDVGFTYVVQALTDAGRGDILYHMLTQDAGPGYVYQLNRGATTLAEAWNLGNASQNHLMIGHGEAWLYRGLAGIQMDPDAIAWKKILIRPQVVEDLGGSGAGKFARASYQSPRGEIASGWTRAGNRLTLTVTIPPTATATIYVPAADPAGVKVAQGTAAPQAAADHAAVFAVDAGTYVFESTLP